MNNFHTGCPEVERTQQTFVQHVNVGGEYQRVEFKKDIVWLQKSETVMQFKHGGEVLVEGSKYEDFYGYLSSTNEHNPAKSAEEYSITANSTLEVVLVTTVFKQPATETQETRLHNVSKPSNRKAMYAYLPNDWRVEIDSDHTPGGKAYPPLNRVVLGSGVTWTSKNTPEQNEALAAEFASKWAVPA